jgi:hypothetical protein
METAAIHILAAIGALLILFLIIWRARKASKLSLKALSVRWPYGLLGGIMNPVP